MRREPHVPYALAESSCALLVRQPAEVAVVVVVIASSAPSVVVVACVVLIAAIVVVTVAVVVDARGPSTSINGVPGVTVGPEPALDRQSCGRSSTAAILVSRGVRVRLMSGWRCPSVTLQPLARGRALRLLRRCCLKQDPDLLAHTSLLRGRCLRAATQ